MKKIPRSLVHLTNEQLLAEVKALACCERESTAQLIASLAELDARELYLAEGFPSLYAYCTQCLRLSEHAAYGRIAAARAARKWPVILDLLAEGCTTLTTVCLLAKHLTAENHLALFEAAKHRTRREVEEQMAALRPLVPERFKVLLSISRETRDKLRLVQDLMRHSVPDGDPAQIFDRALTLLLADLKRKKLGLTERPRAARDSASGSRYVPAAVRREVWKRDEGRCAFVGRTGRCAERGFLEFHHVRPFAEGGEGTVVNLQLRCRAHNQYEADVYFTPSSMDDESETFDLTSG
jgi:hypothetical protein